MKKECKPLEMKVLGQGLLGVHRRLIGENKEE